MIFLTYLDELIPNMAKSENILAWKEFYPFIPEFCPKDGQILFSKYTFFIAFSYVSRRADSEYGQIRDYFGVKRVLPEFYPGFARLSRSFAQTAKFDFRNLHFLVHFLTYLDALNPNMAKSETYSQYFGVKWVLPEFYPHFSREVLPVLPTLVLPVLPRPGFTQCQLC